MASDKRAGRPGFRPVHPGVVVRRNIDALGVTVEDFAARISTTRQTVHAIISGRSSVTPEMAARLARVFDTSSQFWMNMQTNHDVWEPERDPKVKRIQPIKGRDFLAAGLAHSARDGRGKITRGASRAPTRTAGTRSRKPRR
jgi:addiction module HigA family antidote